MKFLDINGLHYLLGKIKDKFYGSHTEIIKYKELKPKEGAASTIIRGVDQHSIRFGRGSWTGTNNFEYTQIGWYNPPNVRIESATILLNGEVWSLMTGKNDGDGWWKTHLNEYPYEDMKAIYNSKPLNAVLWDLRTPDWSAITNIPSWIGNTKPTYTAAEVGAIAVSAKGANNGVAELDANGRVPSSQLPSYVDDVLEYASKTAFPTSGETGKIYIARDSNLTYRWGGSQYIEISPSLALGETSSTAYRGDKGKTAYEHASSKGSAFTSGLYKITTNSHGHVTAATAVTKTDITNLGIPASDTNTWKANTANQEGYVTASAGKADMVWKTDSAGNPTWRTPFIVRGIDSDGTNNLPWHRIATCNMGTYNYVDKDAVIMIRQKANTGYCAIIKITARAETAAQPIAVEARFLTNFKFDPANIKICVRGQAGANASVDVYMKVNVYARQLISVMTESFGWSILSSIETPGATASDKKGSVEVYPSIESACVELYGSGATYNTIRDGVLTYDIMKGATASAAGTAGFVPAPAAGQNTAFLRGDGTWATPTSSGGSVSVGSQGTGNLCLLVNPNGTNTLQRSAVASVYLNGNNLYAGAFYATSDERAKNIKSDLQFDLSDINSIRTIIYSLKDDPKNTDQIGVTAQSVMRCFPDLVNIDEDGMMSVEYSKMSAVAIKAIQMLVDKVAKLEEKVSYLENLKK